MTVQGPGGAGEGEKGPFASKVVSAPEDGRCVNFATRVFQAVGR